MDTALPALAAASPTRRSRAATARARLTRIPLAVGAAIAPCAAVLLAPPEAASSWAALAGAAGALAVGYLVWQAERSVRRDVEEVVGLIHAIEHGRLDGVQQARQGGNLEPVRHGLLRLSSTLSAIVADVRTSAALVEQAGQRLSHDQGELALRTERQAASLEETAASVQQLVDAVRQNAQASREADEQARRVRAASESGAGAMEVAVRSVGAVQSDTAQVRELVSLIDDIAFQTNLLALNAAIEAARAGEKGRGFAVVAAEVRRLAQRCAEESRKIRQLVEVSAGHVEDSVRRIASAGAQVASIPEQMRAMAGEVSRISEASTEQSNGLAEISRAVAQLETITQSNALMVDGTARQALALKERATSLSASVRHFRLMQGTASEAVELVRRAQAAFAGRSLGEFLQAITQQAADFSDRDMYVFVLDGSGSYLAFGGNPAKVGTRVQDIPGVDGQSLLDGIVQQAESEPGWVEYDIVHPLTGRVEPKMSYVVKLADLYVGCGVYKSIVAA